MGKQVKVEQIQIFISGKVQGVGFRYAAQKAAVEFGLSGWVRNLPDGRVEICAEGSANALDALVEWCSVGPPGAGVTQVQVEQRRGLTDTPAETFSIRK